jgi:hypothetical protein
MFWPFRSKPKQTFEEMIADKPEPACGKKVFHYEWTELQGMSCPICHARKEKERKDREREVLAETIASAVIRKLQEKNQDLRP